MWNFGRTFIIFQIKAKVDDGIFYFDEAKFSSKGKNRVTEWQSASTENQLAVFPNMKGKK